MMNKIRIISKALLLALIPLTMLLFHNQLSNWHYHVLGNGIMVKHAHPYNKAENPGTPFSSHKHTDFEFFILGQLSALSLLLVVLFLTLLAVIDFSGKSIFYRFQFPFLQQQILSLQFLRAPPYRQ
jgi:hypothetical protein